LNAALGRYAAGGLKALDDAERKRLSDHKALLGGLVRAALAAHPDAFPGEEHYQLPEHVTQHLLVLSDYD